MKLSSNWLKDYVDHNLETEQLSHLLTMAGLEVDGLETTGSTFEGVVVGHVLDRIQHPDADRLSVCQVDLGEEEPVQIVCGAPNVDAGQKVAVATVGTTLMLPSRENPEEKVPVKIKKAKLRGQASVGMICAEDELGLGDDHDGIMVLAEDASIGQPFAEYLQSQGQNLQDVVFDIAITPNRPDAISHIGMARDVAAIQQTALNRPDITVPSNGGPAAELIDIDIEAPDGCRRYVGMVVQNVTIGPSPAWMQERLTALGLRPINNIVDITNYVMYEVGQPLHAFDYDEIAGKRIVVRYGEPGSTFTTLDGKERELPQKALMICDGDRPVAVAGVMGGENSEVSDTTTNVLLESAYFDPSTIRKTAKALGLQTDASYRFERGVDSNGQAWAAARAAQLMVDLAGGTLVEGMVDAHPNPVPAAETSLRYARIEKIFGIEVPREEVERSLQAIGFGIEVKQESPLEYRVSIPSFRPDVEREIDIIEEVARLYGFDNIPERSIVTIPSATPYIQPAETLKERTLNLIVGHGYREIYTNSMVKLETAEFFNLPLFRGGNAVGDVIQTLKPISQEMASMRPCLLPGALNAMVFNQNHGQRILRFVEFGHVYSKALPDEETIVPGYHEHEALLIALSGPAQQGRWDTKERPADFTDIKGEVEQLLHSLEITDISMTADETPTALSDYHVNLYTGDQYLGVIARLSAEYQEALDLRDPVFFAELNWSTLQALATPKLKRNYRPVSRFPQVDRDLAIIVDRLQEVGPMIQAIRDAGAPLVQQVSVFDIYTGKQVEEDKKSVAFALKLGADRTLKEKEVEKSVRKAVDALQKSFNAELRS